MSYCKSISCPSGTCEGCLKGKLNCGDPACAPYCAGCALPKNHDSAGFLVWLTIIIALAIIIVALMMAYGPRMVIYHNGDPSKPIESRSYADWGSEAIFT